MTHCVILLAVLLAQGFPGQTVSPVGRPTPQTIKIEGCKGQAGCNPVPVDIGGTSVSATTTCRATSAAPTYVEGTDDPISCDLVGNIRTSGGGGGGGTVTANQGTGTGAAAPWSVRVTNGTSFLDPRDRNWLLTASDLVDISDRSGRLLGHVTVDNSSFAVTGTFWQATQPVSGTFWQATQPVSGTFWQATQPVSIAAAIDVSDRASRVVGKVRESDGTLDLTLLNSAPGSDTGQIAVPVRVISQLGAGTGGGGSTATTMYSGTLIVNPATGAVSLPANTSKTVCVRNLRKDYATDGMDHNVYIGSDATLSQYNAGGWVEPGEEDCEAIASSGTVYVFSPGGSQIAYRGVN